MKAAREARVVALRRYQGMLLLVLDMAIIAGSYMLAYYVRFFMQTLAIKVVPIVPPLLYVKNACLLAVLWSFLNWREGAFESNLSGVAAPMIRIRSLLVNGVYATAIMIVVSYMYRGPELSRQVFLLGVPTAIVGMSLLRYVARRLHLYLNARYGPSHSLVVVGSDSHATEFIRRLRESTESFGVRGTLGWGPDPGDGSAVPDVPYLGCLADLPAVHARSPFTTLVLSVHELEGARGPLTPREIMKVVNFCEEHGIDLYSLPSFYDVSVAQTEVGSLSGMPLVLLRDAHLHPLYSVVKRGMDVVVSATVFLVGLPLWLLIAYLIKREDKGPVFFVQTRAGLNGKPFSMYKFRSMVVDAEKKLASLVDLDGLEEPVFKLENDPRVTRVGRFLRRTSLDEVPQLLNVLRGDMSLVGPRPEELAMVQRYDEWQVRRLKAKPGLTGFQQITNRGEPSLAKRVERDLIYMKHQGFLFDCYILLRTLLVVFRGDGRT